MIFFMGKIKKAFVFQRLFLNGLYRIYIGKEAITEQRTELKNALLYRIYIEKEAIY